MSGIRVAALYVETGGVYWNLDDVDPWNEARDARLYAGPWPVVAHPPCRAWSIMSNCRPEIVKGEDGGCFEAALYAVREYGGVLEHPAGTQAWKRYGLQKPLGWDWTRDLLDGGWTCELDQRWYGHEASKPTWLYYIGDDPPNLRWGRARVGAKTVGRSYGQGRSHLRARTPIAFRDVLLDMARSAGRVPAGTPSEDT
jgi:hypothetical protein